MARAKGAPKTGGRKKGTPNKKTPNKKTLVLSEIFDNLNFDVIQRLHDLFPYLKEEKQAQVLLELMSYLYPKRKAIELTGGNGGSIMIETMTPDERK